jgi:cytoskeletal protein CcmA (bactofilin family)
MSLFARRNELPGTDSLRTVTDVTPVAPSSTSALNEIHIEAHDDERNGRIGRGSRLSGELVFEGSVYVYGEVEGEVVAGAAVIVRRGGRIEGKVRATEVVIEGQVTADIRCTGRLEIGATGFFVGTVNTPCLVIHEGARFEGQCSMGSASDGEELIVPDAESHSLELNLAS